MRLESSSKSIAPLENALEQLSYLNKNWVVRHYFRSWFPTCFQQFSGASTSLKTRWYDGIDIASTTSAIINVSSAIKVSDRPLFIANPTLHLAYKGCNIAWLLQATCFRRLREYERSRLTNLVMAYFYQPLNLIQSHFITFL